MNSSPTTPRDWARWLTERARATEQVPGSVGRPVWLSVDQARRLALVLEGLAATVAQLEAECHRLQEEMPWAYRSRVETVVSRCEACVHRAVSVASDPCRTCFSDPARPGFRRRPVTPTESDEVEHPAHYTHGAVECIDAIEAAVTGLEGVEAVLTGQVLKYLWRWRHKGRPLEDLRKARWYLDRLLARSGGGAK